MGNELNSVVLGPPQLKPVEHGWFGGAGWRRGRGGHLIACHGVIADESKDRLATGGGRHVVDLACAILAKCEHGNPPAGYLLVADDALKLGEKQLNFPHETTRGLT